MNQGIVIYAIVEGSILIIVQMKELVFLSALFLLL